MKIKTIFLSLILCTTFSANAQFNIGPEAGLVYSTYSNADNIFSTFQDDFGYALGFSAQQQWNSRWIAAMDLHFFQQRLRAGSTLSPIKLRNNYLRLAPQVELKLLSWLNVGAGFYGHILLNQRFKNPSTDTFQTLDSEANIFDNIDYGLVGGLRFNFNNFYVRTSVNQNLNSISFYLTDINGMSLTTLKTRATNFVLGVGYLLPIRKV